jgi:hypothetical protein
MFFIMGALAPTRQNGKSLNITYILLPSKIGNFCLLWFHNKPLTSSHTKFPLLPMNGCHWWCEGIGKQQKTDSAADQKESAKFGRETYVIFSEEREH